MTYIKDLQHLKNYINIIIEKNIHEIDESELLPIEMYEELRKLNLLDQYTWEIRNNPQLLHENEYFKWRKLRTKIQVDHKTWGDKKLTKEFLDKAEDLKGHSGVYSFFNKDDICLYLGVSVQLSDRVISSFNERFYNYKNTIYLKYLITKTCSDAHVYEVVAISKLKPVYNTTGKFDDELTFEFNLPEFSNPIACNLPVEEVNDEPS